MTKSLTEKWKDGELEEGYYYIRWSFDCDDEPSYMIDFFDTENFTGGAFINKQRKFIDEVICPVPSYDEYNELTRKVENLEWDKKEDDALINFCNKRLVKYHKEIAKLKDQLKEANELIKDYGDEYPMVVKDYLEKWGVK